MGVSLLSYGSFGGLVGRAFTVPCSVQLQQFFHGLDHFLDRAQNMGKPARPKSQTAFAVPSATQKIGQVIQQVSMAARRVAIP